MYPSEINPVHLPKQKKIGEKGSPQNDRKFRRRDNQSGVYLLLFLFTTVNFLLEPLCRRLMAVLGEIALAYEIILVNDGSGDGKLAGDSGSGRARTRASGEST